MKLLFKWILFTFIYVIGYMLYKATFIIFIFPIINILSGWFSNGFWYISVFILFGPTVIGLYMYGLFWGISWFPSIKNASAILLILINTPVAYYYLMNHPNYSLKAVQIEVISDIATLVVFIISLLIVRNESWTWNDNRN